MFTEQRARHFPFALISFRQRNKISEEKCFTNWIYFTIFFSLLFETKNLAKDIERNKLEAEAPWIITAQKAQVERNINFIWADILC